MRNVTCVLTGTENHLTLEQMRYNQAVRAYTKKFRLFPTWL
nr:LemA family protein [Nostoc flagelliforme]